MSLKDDFDFDTTMKTVLGFSAFAMFIWALIALCSDLDASKGVGLMLGVLVIQNWKRNLQ